MTVDPSLVDYYKHRWLSTWEFVNDVLTMKFYIITLIV